jgi:Aminoglycoside-2''-adenylyltransferase
MSFDDRASVQLQAIASLDSACTSAGIDYWLFGGWAVDFWVGRVTREHDDVDAAAWRLDFDAIKTALEIAGWRHAPVAGEAGGTRYTWRTAEVEFTFLETRDDGAIVIPLADQPIVWSVEPFGEHRARLNGVGARVIPLELLRSGKQTPRHAADEAAKDRADAEALARI